MEQNVAASTQNQAFSALLFLYRNVLKIDLGPVDALRAKKPTRLPTVLTREEVKTVIAALSGTNQLIAQLLYGSGLRLLKCLRLPVKDLDFAYRQITVRDGKTVQELPGHKDVKTTMIYTAGPQSTTHVQKTLNTCVYLR